MPVGIEPCSNSPASSNSKPDPVDGGTFHHLDILNITLKLIPVSLKSCIGSKFPSKKPPWCRVLYGSDMRAEFCRDIFSNEHLVLSLLPPKSHIHIHIHMTTYVNYICRHTFTYIYIIIYLHWWSSWVVRGQDLEFLRSFQASWSASLLYLLVWTHPYPVPDY